jgi:AraC-like DNA-binding protein
MDLMWLEGRFVFAGADTTAMLSPYGGVATWGLRLPPGAAHSLLGISARELADQRVDLGDLVRVPPEAVDVAGIDPAAGLELALLALWRQAPPEPSVLRVAASLDSAARAGLSVPDIAHQHGMSERTLRRLSDKLFGYGPKMLTSIYRFQHALYLARSGTPLGEASTMAGYADQSHLNRHARRLAGTTPGALIV